MEGKGAKSYPTLYLLHGLSDDHTIWQRRTSIERYVSNLGIAVVMPSTGRCWYTDSPSGNYFTYVAKELPEICREFFPNMSPRREDTYIAGLSMGGYGAFKIAMSCPETFSKAASLSGVMDISARVARYPHIFTPDTVGSDNDLFALSKKLKESGKPMPSLFQWCGTEDNLYPSNVEMKGHLESLGYDLTYSESEGIHAWEYWDEQIRNVLKWITNK
jgi:putative tributyrin esterase